jgi:centrosomal protein CEP41
MSLDWGNNANMPNRKSTLDKRPPRSSKYNDVKSRIDTGTSIQKLKQVTARQVNKRRDEQFFRITPLELNDLLSEYEMQDQEEHIDMNQGFADFNPRIVIHNENDEAKIERPYLILDVRDEQSFRSSHIMQARNFPQRLLMQDRSTKELVKFKSVEGKLVVLYDDAQSNREAAAAAQILASRGFDNIFVLVGGISEFASKYNHRVDGQFSRQHDKNDGIHSHKNRDPASSHSSNSSSTSSHSGGSNNYDHSSNHHGGGGGYNTSRSSSSYHHNQDTRSQKMSSMKSQCQSSSQEYSRPSHSSYGSSNNHYNNHNNNHQQLSLKSLHQRSRPINDERASRMSNVSVADSVISRAQIRKTGNVSSRYR